MFKPKADKVYYCLCGAEMKIVGDNLVGWATHCCHQYLEGFHITMNGTFSTEAALLAELERLPKIERKDI